MHGYLCWTMEVFLKERNRGFIYPNTTLQAEVQVIHLQLEINVVVAQYE